MARRAERFDATGAEPDWTPIGTGLETTRLVGGDVLVRATGDPGGPVLRYTPAEMEAFVRGARDGEFDDLAACDGGTDADR